MSQTVVVTVPSNVGVDRVRQTTLRLTTMGLSRYTVRRRVNTVPPLAKKHNVDIDMDDSEVSEADNDLRVRSFLSPSTATHSRN